MNRILSICLVLVSVFSLNQLYAQEQESGSLNSGTIDSQFEYIYSISNNFQEYKVVKRSNLDKLQANILDSMQTMRAQVSDLNLLIGSQKDSIHSLNGVVATLETEKQEAIAEKDNFTFLGVGILKSVYSSIMWIIVGVLAAALAFFSYQYFQSFSKIKKAERDLQDVQDEFDAHRKNMVERERKLKRELIDAQLGR